jgi:hypothetical protein
LDPKPINLDHFLNGLQEFLQRTLRERIEVQTVGSAGLWAVEVDANHLESASSILPSMREMRCREGGKLTIEAVNVSSDEDYFRWNPELGPGQYVVICVTATAGSPIPELLAIAIFRRAGAHDEPSRSNRPEPPVAHSGMKKPRTLPGLFGSFQKAQDDSLSTLRPPDRQSGSSHRPSKCCR